MAALFQHEYEVERAQSLRDQQAYLLESLKRVELASLEAGLSEFPQFQVTRQFFEIESNRYFEVQNRVGQLKTLLQIPNLGFPARGLPRHTLTQEQGKVLFFVSRVLTEAGRPDAILDEVRTHVESLFSNQRLRVHAGSIISPSLNALDARLEDAYNFMLREQAAILNAIHGQEGAEEFVDLLEQKANLGEQFSDAQASLKEMELVLAAKRVALQQLVSRVLVE